MKTPPSQVIGRLRKNCCKIQKKKNRLPKLRYHPLPRPTTSTTTTRIPCDSHVWRISGRDGRSGNHRQLGCIGGARYVALFCSSRRKSIFLSFTRTFAGFGVGHCRHGVLSVFSVCAWLVRSVHTIAQPPVSHRWKKAFCSAELCERDSTLVPFLLESASLPVVPLCRVV